MCADIVHFAHYPALISAPNTHMHFVFVGNNTRLQTYTWQQILYTFNYLNCYLNKRIYCNAWKFWCVSAASANVRIWGFWNFAIDTNTVNAGKRIDTTEFLFHLFTLSLSLTHFHPVKSLSVSVSHKFNLTKMPYKTHVLNMSILHSSVCKINYKTFYVSFDAIIQYTR